MKHNIINNIFIKNNMILNIHQLLVDIYCIQKGIAFDYSGSILKLEGKLSFNTSSSSFLDKIIDIVDNSFYN